MALMGAESVEYHERNVADRADDHAGEALAYYGSRGETPLAWGGSGAKKLGVEGEATPDAYRAVFGLGGVRLPRTGAKLVSTRRPGLELVVSPHKSVAELGVLGRADDMHAIVDAERDATLAYLDAMVRRIGGRRGDPARFTPTSGLTWATSRHATTRAGDPGVHDHVLIANVVWMGDERAGWKALDTAFVRDQLHAATAVGRMAAARRAVELGYAIEPDAGRSGRLGGWRIAGIPDEALAVHSKRTAQIDAMVGEHASPRSRQIAAHKDRDPKRHEPVADLLARWRAELADAGFPPAEMWRHVTAAARHRPPVIDRLDDETLAVLIRDTLALDGRLSRLKVFDRADVILTVAPTLHGLPLSELDRVVNAVIADAGCVPLIGVAGARTQAYATGAVLAAEAHVARLAERLAGQTAPHVAPEAAVAALGRAEERMGAQLTPGQRRAATGLLTSGGGLELVVGVAGSGKTAMLAAAADGFTACGLTVLGTATAGQAARTLGEEAGLGESRTIASLLWRLERDRIRLGPRHVVIVDEAGMTDDPDLARLLAAVTKAKAKLVVVGDDRQLSPVGPGGGLGALLARHLARVHTLTLNVRQHDPAERRALAELRAGRVERAVSWYAQAGRVVPTQGREGTVETIVAAWAADISAGKEALLLAWRRVDVEALNVTARAAWAELGRLSGPELEAPGGRRYAAGDRVLMLSPEPDGAWVTSEHATVLRVDTASTSLTAVTAGGRVVHLDRDAVGPNRLAHSYALTVHRAQGVTCDTAHVLERGGGRELAYVAMSRARQATHVYVPAGDLDDAAEQLRWSWAAERRQRWATDQGAPAPTVAQLSREWTRLTAFIDRQAFAETAGDGFRRFQRVQALQAELDELRTGTGRHASTSAGQAAQALDATERDLYRARRDAGEATGPFSRRRARRQVEQLETDRDQADLRYQQLAGPERERLHAALDQTNVSDPPRYQAREAWLDQHPDVRQHYRALALRIGQAEPAPRIEIQPSQDLDLGL
jgi:conjugative relaxase-like TrwC/TraI family protein